MVEFEDPFFIQVPDGWASHIPVLTFYSDTSNEHKSPIISPYKNGNIETLWHEAAGQPVSLKRRIDTPQNTVTIEVSPQFPYFQGNMDIVMVGGEHPIYYVTGKTQNDGEIFTAQYNESKKLELLTVHSPTLNTDRSFTDSVRFPIDTKAQSAELIRVLENDEEIAVQTKRTNKDYPAWTLGEEGGWHIMICDDSDKNLRALITFIDQSCDLQIPKELTGVHPNLIAKGTAADLMTVFGTGTFCMNRATFPSIEE
jgi:hypothetical protein